MRWAVLFLVFFVGCSSVPQGSECKVDGDCVKSGCSGTVCQSKDAEKMYSTCEWKSEYACYKQIACGCSNGYCQWDKDASFEKCVKESSSIV